MAELWWIEQALRWLMGAPQQHIDERYAVSPEDPNSLAAAWHAARADTLHPEPIAAASPRMFRREAIAELRSALVAGEIVAETAEGPVLARHWKFHAVDGDLRVRFDPDAVMRRWPRLKPTVADFVSDTIKRGQPVKYGDQKTFGFIKEIMEATDCTRDEARQAHGELPKELRRGRGNGDPR